MDITLKLFASLADYLPEGARMNQVILKREADITVGSLIAEHHLPDKLVHLVLINGSFVPPEQRAGLRLKDGDVVAIWPPIAGG